MIYSILIQFDIRHLNNDFTGTVSKGVKSKNITFGQNNDIKERFELLMENPDLKRLDQDRRRMRRYSGKGKEGLSREFTILNCGYLVSVQHHPSG